MGEALPKNPLMASREENCPVRVAAIGCGYWGKNLVRNFAELGALAAICDPDRDAARELAERHHASVAEFDAVLRDDEIAAVAIAAPAALHAELASRALEAVAVPPGLHQAARAGARRGARAPRIHFLDPLEPGKGEARGGYSVVLRAPRSVDDPLPRRAGAFRGDRAGRLLPA
ncbi:MAG: hypothetical protein E6G83_11345 [Alphaproteobacteria bacterium]|nr:MAG: hypothetical protein E6G83_11345 [Alphaproteobacteria bacterium]